MLQAHSMFSRSTRRPPTTARGVVASRQAARHRHHLYQHCRTQPHPHRQQQRHVAHAAPHDQHQHDADSVRHQPDSTPSTSGRDAEAPSDAGSNVGRLLLLGGLVAAAAAAVAAGGGVSGLQARVHDLERVIASSGYLGPLIYAAAYSGAALLLLPASVLTLAAGYLFGPVQGTMLASLSAAVGACLAFLVARYLARPMVEARLAGNPRFRAVYNRIAADGAKLVLLMRLSPLFPYSVINTLCGITRVKLLDFALASWVGMLPSTAAYAYLGSVGKAAATAAANGTPLTFDAAKAVFYVGGGIATVWATKLISQAATQAIDEEQGASAA